MKKRIPRILLAAGASGSGKTLLTCGLLQVLVNRGIKTVSFKCGPDYIDPMFHTQVIGTKSRNLDTFFTGEEITRYLLAKNSADCEIAVMEGVMGFYDGVAGTTTLASAYDLARVTDTPVILIVNSKGMSVSLAAYIKGFLEYKKDSRIKGVIFNQMSPMLYPRMKKLVEEELGIKVLGYVPRVEDCVIEPTPGTDFARRNPGTEGTAFEAGRSAGEQSGNRRDIKTGQWGTSVGISIVGKDR